MNVGFRLAVILLLALTSPVMAQRVASAPPQQYVREDLASSALRLEERLRKESPAPGARSATDLRSSAVQAARRNDLRGALAQLGASIVLAPVDAQSWLLYARLARTMAGQDQNNAWRWNETALSAAYAAFQHAGNRREEANALALVGAVQASQGMFRLSLNAYRASLDRSDDAATRATYEKLRAERGFRILDYKVDNDAASPRACFRFSEPLARGKVDFAPYVAISGAADGAISTEEQQLCVEGLRHGQRYAIVIREGLPSSVGESLLKSADYEIYVKDRAPRVRFTGKNYVLPSVGQDGIPVVSVNTNRVAVDVLRIGDRNLLPTVRSQNFLAQIGGYGARQLIDESGQKIWSGTLDVRPELNKDVVTAFPIAEAVGKMQAGVYVMIARPGEKTVSSALAGDDDVYEQQATQWFVVSDIGLTSFSGADGVHVFVRSLATAEPISGVELRLVARNNEVLATRTSGADGHVAFDPGLSRGSGGLAPGLVVASRADDYGFLDLAQTAFDLTDRGVKGRKAAQALDAYVYPERGVYRSGETVDVSILLRNTRGVAVPDLPLTLVVRRPDGVEYKRARVGDQGAGGRAFSVQLLSGAASGAWRVLAYADPRSPPIGEAGFLVEDYVPERLDLTLTPQEKVVTRGASAHVDASARYLYGAPGAGLEITGEVVIEAATNLSGEGLENYTAGLQDEPFEPLRSQIETSVTTDAEGRAVVEVPIPQVDAPRPVSARIILRAGEAGGRAVERVVTLSVRPAGGVIAVRKLFDNLSDGGIAGFDLLAIAPDGARLDAKNLHWSLYRVNNDYQWYNSEGRWGFERVKSSRRIADGRLDASAGGPVRLAAPVSSGAHRLDITSDDGSLLPTSISFNVGWSGDASADTPDLLEVTLDKSAYAAGDEMKMRIASHFAGKVDVAIVSDRMHEVRTADIRADDNEIVFPVQRDWGPGAYAVALAHRPLDVQARRMPGRALGLAWFDVDRDSRRLVVDLAAPDRTQPRQRLSIPVRIDGLSPGEDAFVTLAAVDVGILSLTRYEAPDATQFFFGQKQLSTEIRDLYGLLIDGMQGSRGAIRSGGDGAGRALDGNRPTQAPLARYSGVVKVGADGVANIDFDLPAFNGSIRVMAVAWTRDRVGQASKDVVVRDPVVVQASVPRFLTLGDASRIHVRLDNLEGEAGDYELAVDPQGGLALADGQRTRRVRLEKGGKTDVSLSLRATALGAATIDLSLSGPGTSLSQSLALQIEPGSGEIQRRIVRTIQPRQSLSLSRDLLADLLPGTGSVSVAVSPYAGLDVAALLQSLDRYPYGCSEQTVSRAMPLLYVDRLASTQALGLDGDARKRVTDSIDRVLARQDSTGAFGLWTSDGAGSDLWLDAFVTDFLTRAREGGYTVAQRSFDSALDRLRNQVVNVGEVTPEQGPSIAYAIYVLARNGRPIMGDLRYLADTKLASFETVLSRAQLAAALSLLGDRSRAQSIFAAAAGQLEQTPPARLSRADYGSRLRDAAGLMALAAESGADNSVVSRASATLRQDRAATSALSTQEMNWMVLAAAALSQEARATSLDVAGEPHEGALYRTWRAQDLGGDVVIANRAAAPAQVVITTSGHPAQSEPSASRGYQVERSIFGLDGSPRAATSLVQNERVVVVLKVTELEAAYGRLLLVDRLPAGLEIDNPALFEGGSVAALAFAKPTVAPVYSEFRDDRFVAAFERNGQERATFNVSYIARAVTPGRYLYPPASIEDMYRPERFGRTGTGMLDVLEARR